MRIGEMNSTLASINAYYGRALILQNALTALQDYLEDPLVHECWSTLRRAFDRSVTQGDEYETERLRACEQSRE